MSLLAANTLMSGRTGLGRCATRGSYAAAAAYHDRGHLDRAVTGADSSRLVIVSRDQQLPEPAVITEVVRNPTPAFAVALLRQWAILHYTDDEVDEHGGLVVRVHTNGPDETYHAGAGGTPVPYSAVYSAELRGWSTLQLAVITHHAGVRDLPSHLVAATEYGIEISLPPGRTVAAANFASATDARAHLHNHALPQTQPAIVSRISYPCRADNRNRRPVTGWAPLLPTDAGRPAGDGKHFGVDPN